MPEPPNGSVSALPDRIRTNMLNRLQPPPATAGADVRPHHLIVQYYNIKARIDSILQDMHHLNRLPEDYGNMMLSPRGFEVQTDRNTRMDGHFQVESN
jgi:hypothetical protein